MNKYFAHADSVKTDSKEFDYFVEVYLASVVDARIAELEKALRELDDLYARVWDRVDGALVLLPDSIPRFEAAHEQAQRLLMVSSQT